MRKLLLVLFLLSLTSNALAEDERWSYIYKLKLANGQLEDFLSDICDKKNDLLTDKEFNALLTEEEYFECFNSVWDYPSQEWCESILIEQADKYNLKVQTKKIDNVIKLILEHPYNHRKLGNIIVHHSCSKIIPMTDNG